jgi:hypothetical protein
MDAQVKFRKKPIVIEAIKFDGTNGLELQEWIGRNLTLLGYKGDKQSLFITTLEGMHEATPGDWIIKGIKGEFYPCKSDIFAATYEPVPDGHVHTVPTGEPEHYESKDCWCEPELVEDFTETGGRKLYLHKEAQ